MSKKKFISLFGVFGLIVVFASFGFIRALSAKGIGEKIYSSLDSVEEFPIVFNYPANWKVQKMRGGNQTPFSVILSDTDLSDFQARNKKGYPDKFINIVFYRTSQTESEYAQESLKYSNIVNLQVQDVATKNDVFKKYKGDRLLKSGNQKTEKYIVSYKKIKDFLIIIESRVASNEDEKEVDSAFDRILETIKI